MEIRELQISPEKFNAIPEPERVFLIHLGHIANEITFLHKLVLFCSGTSECEVEQQGKNSQALFAVRLLCGKLWEAWKCIKRDFVSSRIGRHYHSRMSDEGRRAQKKLKKYFGGASLINDVRNRFAFHYSADTRDLVPETLRSIEPGSYKFYLNEDPANSLYYLSDVVTNFGMFELAGETTQKKALETLFDEVTEVSCWLLRFCDHCIVGIIESNLDSVDFSTTTLQVRRTPQLDDVEIPFFVRR